MKLLRRERVSLVRPSIAGLLTALAFYLAYRSSDVKTWLPLSFGVMVFLIKV